MILNKKYLYTFIFYLNIIRNYILELIKLYENIDKSMDSWYLKIKYKKNIKSIDILRVSLYNNTCR